jgi:flagellar hook protein FlgE
MTNAMNVAPGPALLSAARGMTDAGRRMDVAAQNVANVSTEGEAGSLDLASALVDATILAPIAYTANATVLRAAAEMQRALLDLHA